MAFLTKRIAAENEATALTSETMKFIDSNIPDDYLWLGNVRELEQCVRNILIRGEYRPQTQCIDNTNL